MPRRRCWPGAGPSRPSTSGGATRRPRSRSGKRCGRSPPTGGRPNSRERAEQGVGGRSQRLSGEHWDKFKRALARPESCAYLDRLHSRVEALPVSAEVEEAVVLSEGVGQKPGLVAGGGEKAGVMRGLLL